MKQIFNWEYYAIEQQKFLIPEMPFKWYEYIYIASFQDILKAIENDWSVIAVVSGDPRTGKSTLATWLQIWYYKKKNLNKEEIKQKIRENSFYRFEDFDLGKRKECIVFHEAVMLAYKRTAMSKININVVKFLTTLQRYNNLYIFVIPSFDQLDKDLRNNFVDIVFKIVRRGIALIYLKIPVDIGLKRKNYWYRVAGITFPDLPEEFKKVLIEIDEKNKETIKELIEKKTKQSEEQSEGFDINF